MGSFFEKGVLLLGVLHEGSPIFVNPISSPEATCRKPAKKPQVKGARSPQEPGTEVRNQYFYLGEQILDDIPAAANFDPRKQSKALESPKSVTRDSGTLGSSRKYEGSGLEWGCGISALWSCMMQATTRCQLCT